MNTMKPIRLWPGVVAVALMWVLRFGVEIVLPDYGMQAMLAGLGCVLLVLAWWLLFSRAPWVERISAILFAALAVFLARFAVHPSIAGGMMGMMPIILSIPLVSLALVLWAAVSGRIPAKLRLPSLAIAMVLACVPLLLMRTDGVRGSGSDMAWRWTPTAEERLLAQTKNETLAPVTPAGVPAATPAAVPTATAAAGAATEAPKDTNAPATISTPAATAAVARA